MLKIIEDGAEASPEDQKFVFKSASEFSKYIITRATVEQRDCMNVLIEFCEERDIEIEDVVRYVDRALKDRIAFELIEGGYAPRTTTSDVGNFFVEDDDSV